MASGETSCPESTPRSSGSSPAPYTLAVGTLPDTMHTRYCTHSDVTRDEPAAERRRCLLKVMLGRSCALTSLQDLRVAGPYQRVAGMKHELNGERGEAEVPRGQDHGVKCSQVGQLKDFIHTTTRCYSTETPGFQDSSGWVPICNFVISLSFFLFLLKKKKKMRPGWEQRRTLLTLSEAGRQLALSALAEGQPQLKQAANNLLGLSFLG